MMRFGRRKSSPPPKAAPIQHQQASIVRPLALLFLVLITALLVLTTLPQSTDYAQYMANQVQTQEERAVKGIVVSHGFLKISVQVAYKAKNKPTDAPVHLKPPPPSSVNPTPKVKPPTPPGLGHAGDVRTKKPSSSMASVDSRHKGSSGDTLSNDEDQAMSQQPPLPREPPPVMFKVAPLESKPLTKEDILVDVIFHRVNGPVDDSLLSCRLTDEDVLAAIKEATRIWQRQAKILLRFGSRSTEWESVSLETQAAFEEHLARFPRNDETGQPWTTENPGRIGLVASDLIQILSPHDQKQWLKLNPIHVYCIGAFVGYNGVTWSRHVFIRSVKYHKTDVQMDRETFTRILAHEIGHVLHLPHPSMETCSIPCDTSTCNLMCQQRWLPPTTDVRLARSLTSLQVSRSRTAAALLDTFMESSVQNTPNRPVRVLGIGTELVANTRPSKASLVLLPKPIPANESLMVAKVAILVSKLKMSCTVALVVGHPVPNQADAVFSLKARALGTFQNSLSVKSGISKLVFEDIDLGWWTNARHIEATVEPPFQVHPGEYVGIAFSSPTVTLQLQKRAENEMFHTSKVTSSIFSLTRTTSTEAKMERISGTGPLFGVITHPVL